MSLGPISTRGKDPAGRTLGSVVATTRGNNSLMSLEKSGNYHFITTHFHLPYLKKWKWLSGKKYFGGGPVVSVPFVWFHLCVTINYLPSKEAVRWDKKTLSEKKIPRKIYVNGELNYEFTTEYIPEVGAIRMWRFFEKTGWVERWAQLNHRGSRAWIQWDPPQGNCNWCSGLSKLTISKSYLVG